jgi:hypothetical protein
MDDPDKAGLLHRETIGTSRDLSELFVREEQNGKSITLKIVARLNQFQSLPRRLQQDRR